MASRTKTEQTEHQHRLENPFAPSPSQLHSLALLRAERDRQREAESLRPESGGLAVQEYDPGDVEGSEVVAWLRTVS